MTNPYDYFSPYGDDGYYTPDAYYGDPIAGTDEFDLVVR
jgi:hypothetical protein